MRAQGQLPRGVELGGNAFMDADFGVTVDGEGDYVSLGPGSAEKFGQGDGAPSCAPKPAQPTQRAAARPLVLSHGPGRLRWFV
jgi:hypothetical protein